MNENFFDDLLSTIDNSPAGQAFDSVVNTGESALAQKAAGPLQGLFANVGPLLVGIGCFMLGSLMIVFGAFDDIAQTAEKALGIVSDPVGSAVGKGKPLLKKALTDILP